MLRLGLTLMTIAWGTAAQAVLLSPIEVEETARIASQIQQAYVKYGASYVLKRLQTIAAEHEVGRTNRSISSTEYAERVRLMEDVNAQFNRLVARQGKSFLGELSALEQDAWIRLFRDPSNLKRVIDDEVKLRGSAQVQTWLRQLTPRLDSLGHGDVLRAATLTEDPITASSRQRIGQILSAKGTPERYRVLEQAFLEMSRRKEATAYHFADLTNAFLLAEARDYPGYAHAASGGQARTDRMLKPLFERFTEFLTYRSKYADLTDDIPRSQADFVDLYDLCASRLKDSGQKVAKPTVLYAAAQDADLIAQAIVGGLTETKHPRALPALRSMAQAESLSEKARMSARLALTNLSSQGNLDPLLRVQAWASGNAADFVRNCATGFAHLTRGKKD